MADLMEGEDDDRNAKGIQDLMLLSVPMADTNTTIKILKPKAVCKEFKGVINKIRIQKNNTFRDLDLAENHQMD